MICLLGFYSLSDFLSLDFLPFPLFFSHLDIQILDRLLPQQFCFCLYPLPVMLFPQNEESIHMVSLLRLCFCLNAIFSRVLLLTILFKFYPPQKHYPNWASSVPPPRHSPTPALLSQQHCLPSNLLYRFINLSIIFFTGVP